MTSLLGQAEVPGPATAPQPLLVALRDPEADRPTITWAARRAAFLGRPLTVMHAIADASLMAPGSSYGDQVIAGRDVLARASGRIADQWPELRLSTYLHCGDVVKALLGLSAAVSLIVVGADRRNELTAEFEGSVALQVALNSTTAVVVVPHGRDHPEQPAPAAGGVVVGVDGSEASRAALLYAAGEAVRLNSFLTVVTSLAASSEPMPVNASAMLLEVRTRYPECTVTWVVEDLHAPLQALTRHGRGAELLVIGRHGRGASNGMSLGSVTHALLLEPPCPTLVVTA